MKYYSEKLNKFYDTPDACQRAEFEAKEKENLEKIVKKIKQRRNIVLAISSIVIGAIFLTETT